MQTNVSQSICPNCGAIDHDELVTYTLIETILCVECHCPKCGENWNNQYGLFYLGYSDSKGNYDRDGLKLRY